MTGVWEQLHEGARNESVTVNTASSIIAEARNEINKRKAIVIRNISSAAADIITVNFGFRQAVANAGVVLRQYESVQDSTESGYDAYQGPITAICETANGVLSIMER